MSASRFGFQRRALAAEKLESREVLAGNVMAVVFGEMLVLWGDAANNSVSLTYNSANQHYQVVGHDAGGAPTTVNGLDTSQPANLVDFSGVKSVAVLLNGGDDTFQVGSPAAVDTVISKWMSIDMGDGDDHVILGQAGNAAGGFAPVESTLHTGGSVTVVLGKGNDNLEIASADIGRNLNIGALEGDDHVTFPTEFTPAGASTPQVFGVLVRGSAAISLGSGADVLDMRNVTIQGNLQILDGEGAADLTLSSVNVNKTLTIVTGNDADHVTMASVRAAQLSLGTNDGIDTVAISNSKFTKLVVQLGAARDALDLQNVQSTKSTSLDGGVQGSHLSGSGNHLARLSTHNLG